MAPVVRELARRGVPFTLCTTGQHGALLEPILELFGLVPDIRLNVMREGQSLAQLHGRLLIEIDAIVERLQPSWVLAQGDTTTVLAGATVAFYRGVRFGHVEAGLRSGDFGAPFPEEMNRRVADLTAARHWAPTESARDALLREGIAASSIEVTGNTVIDALHLAAEMPYDWDASPLGAWCWSRLTGGRTLASRCGSCAWPFATWRSGLATRSSCFRCTRILTCGSMWTRFWGK
jgi:UDP-N-acetylglucosamine 2-epimerase (non-hydrolysing)